MWVYSKQPSSPEIPSNTEKGISVSLPTWEDTVGWSSRNPKVLACLKTGYPRFFIPRIVDDLAARLLERAPLVVPAGQKATPSCSDPSARHARLALLFPCGRFAQQCQEFLVRVGMAEQAQVHIFSVDMTGSYLSMGSPPADSDCRPRETYVVAYPADLFPQAKSFWQHTGRGISSRYASYWLENAPVIQGSLLSTNSAQGLLPIKEANDAKMMLRKRIAALSSTDRLRVRSEDVFLYPTGMASICSTADILRKSHISHSEVCRVAVFG
jgi:cystathionine gamma-synthase